MIEPAADVTGVDAVDTVAQYSACPKCAGESAASSNCFAELGVFFKAVDRELEKPGQFTASHRTSVRHKCELRPANTCTRCCSLKAVHVAVPHDRDLAAAASLVCGLSVAALAVRLRWLDIAMCALGAAGPVPVGFALQWVRAEWGQITPSVSVRVLRHPATSQPE
jgi:hypothetical protein